MPDPKTDEGFSLVEVIIAMFLLMVIALAVLPLMIGATRVSVSNKDLVAATTFANAQLAPIRAAFPFSPSAPTSCAVLRAKAASGVADSSATGLLADVSIGSCPVSAADYPGTVSVTVRVYRSTSTGTTVVRLPTRVTVSGP